MAIKIFLCGDASHQIRGIDQILLHPVDPILYEASIRDARGYVRLAEEGSGPIAAPAHCFRSRYPGDARGALSRPRVVHPADQPRDQRHHQRRPLGG